MWFTLAALPSNRSFGLSMSTSSSSSLSLLENKLKGWGSGGDPSQLFLLDGGTGEELFQRGVPDDRKIWSAMALVHSQYHDTLAKVHRSFLEAGADAITTNSYGVVPGVGFSPDEIVQYVTTAGRIARQVVDDFEKTRTTKDQTHKLVLGSMGPLVESYRPDKLMDPPEGIKMYGIIAKALAPFVDLFIAETMGCVGESTQAIRAVAQLNSEMEENDDKSAAKSMLVSYTLDSHGKLRDGESPTKAILRTLDVCKEANVQCKCFVVSSRNYSAFNFLSHIKSRLRSLTPFLYFPSHLHCIITLVLGVLFNCATPE